MPTAIFGNMPYAKRHFVSYAICQQHICIFILINQFSRLNCIVFNNLSLPVVFLARRKGRPAGKGSAGLGRPASTTEAAICNKSVHGGRVPGRACEPVIEQAPAEPGTAARLLNSRPGRTSKFRDL
jgi:hypothetical protein